MRTLYLVRHAKSSWAEAGLDDFDRPLNERGLRDAPEMAQRFKARNEPVDLLVSSPAVRALSTARFFADALGIAEITTVDRIYEAHHRSIQHLIEELPDTAQRVMLFGHNPGFSSLAEHLAHGGLGELPTCAIVRIDLVAGSWKEIAEGTGNVVWWDYPKNG